MVSSNLFDLTGRRAIITGAASGIGRATCLGLARAGAAVFLADLDEPGMAAVAQAVANSEQRAASMRVDVTLEAEANAMARRAVEAFGGVDILVNAAGINIRGAILERETSDLEKILRVNLMGVLYCCRAVGRVMVEQRSGSIINLSSIMGTIAGPRGVAYATSKGGVSQLTRGLAVEWAPHGVRVNAVGPGYCRTPLIDEILQDPAWVSRIEARTPMGRLAEPEEIVGPILFLASEAASYVTGTVLYVDGGYTAS